MDYLSAIVLFDAFLAVVVTYIVTKMNGKLWIKYSLIPIIILATWFSINKFDDILGFPYMHEPVGDFELVTHRIAIRHSEVMLQVWGIQQGQSRLYQFEYSASLDQAMTKAEGLKGHRIVFNIHKKHLKSPEGTPNKMSGSSGREQFNNTDDIEFVIKDITPPMPSKDEEPN